MLDSSCEQLANLNPFRYRSYYYDTETDLYFLKTRYYDPEIGRFISIDSISYLNPNAINGLNLYAYCNNNPVMAIDPNGNVWYSPLTWNWQWAQDAGAALTDFGYKVEQTVSNVYNEVKTTVVGVYNSVDTIVTNIRNDIAAYDINNANPQKVIDANYFSAYQGEFALKSSFLGTSVFSFGIMIIGSNVPNDGSGENLVRHEYGHYLQLKDKGLLKFIFEVAIPSVTAYWVDEAKKLPYKYLSLSWEYEASQLGGDSDISGITTTYTPSVLEMLGYLF